MNDHDDADLAKAIIQYGGQDALLKILWERVDRATLPLPVPAAPARRGRKPGSSYDIFYFKELYVAVEAEKAARRKKPHAAAMSDAAALNLLKRKLRINNQPFDGKHKTLRNRYSRLKKQYRVPGYLQHWQPQDMDMTDRLANMQEPIDALVSGDIPLT